MRLPEMSIRQRLDAITDKIKEKYGELRGKALGIYTLLSDKTSKALKLKELFLDERYADARKCLFSGIMSVLMEARPRRGSGRIVYGSGDPFQTGTAMEAAAMLYPVYRDSIEIIPVFDQSALDVDIDIKGRIRLIVVVAAGIRILLNRKLRQMYKRARRILNE